ncbi:hypothetical protein [Symbiopectobacterium purcellii]|uniref:hypothetical protein n=1 Tax=Symbiopectobacterium purcellii TaxID=2871826 RepID=UPI003F87A7C1
MPFTQIILQSPIAGIKRLGCMTQISRNRRPFIDDIANRLKNDYILCPDMRQRSIAGCYQNNVAWLYLLTP